MNLILSPVILIMIVAAIICFFIAVYVWPHRRNNSETIPLILLLLGITEWITAALIGLLDQDLSHKIIWAQIEYIGVVSVPLMVLVFVSYHSGIKKWLTFKWLVLLALIPVATLILAWTNANHSLIWITYIPYLENGLLLSQKTYGLGFWVYWIYSYVVLAAATFLTFRIVLIKTKVFRWQSILIMIGILMPWVGNLLYVLHINPFNIDITPLAFSVTGIMLAIGMFRWQLFDIKPIAQAAVITGMKDGVIILDNLNRIVDVNAAAQSFLGLDVQKLIGKQMEQIITDWLPLDERSNQRKGNVIEIKLKSGKKTLDYELNDSPFYEKNGSFGGTIIFLREITEKKYLEEKLKEAKRKQLEITEQMRVEKLLLESQMLLQQVVDSSPILIYLVDKNGRFLLVNRKIAEIFGTSVDKLIGKNRETIMPKKIAQSHRENDLIVMKSGTTIILEENNPESDGIHTYHTTKFPIIDSNGKIYAVGGISSDITDRKKAEYALRMSEEQNRTILQTAMDGFWLADSQGRLLEVNEAYCKMSGYSLQELLAMRIPDLEAAEAVGDTAAHIQKIIKQGEGRFETCHRRKDGSSFDVSASVQYRPEEGGQFVVFIQDITEQKRNQIDLQNSVSKLRTTVEGTIETIALIVEARDPYTSGHQQRVSDISVKIAKDLGLPEEQIRGIYMAGLIHDLGKIRVPAEILSKPGQLTKLDFDMIKTHPKVGYDLLKNIEFPWPIAQIIYQHHEREDGSGYPRKLKGGKILLEAKIIGIADVIEAMSSHRPYRPALGMGAALDEIVKHKGTLYDTTIVASYLKVIKKGYKFRK